MQNHRQRPHSLSAYVIATTQILSARLTGRVLRMTGSLDFHGVELDGSSSYIFVANHQSRIDPFVIFGAMNFRQDLKVSPVRFMTARGIYYTPLRPFLALHGCYSAKGGKDAVKQSAYYIESGYNICLFPEGRRVLREESQPREGIMRILEQSIVTPQIVMAHLEWQRSSFWKRKVTLRLELLEDRPHDAVSLMQRVYEV